MTRVHIICEGQTEETFVNEVLGPHLAAFEVYPAASLVGRPGHKGGHVNTARMTSDICLRLLGDPTAWCTTFFDYYGLDSNFVGKQAGNNLPDSTQKAVTLETALFEYVTSKAGEGAVRRFIPYVQMYEFEGLLFSDPQKLASGLYTDALEQDFAKIRQSFTTPEEINDSPHTAPSKRILRLVPGYDKVLLGSLAAIEIGLDSIRRECPRFNDWMNQLESLQPL